MKSEPKEGETITLAHLQEAIATLRGKKYPSEPEPCPCGRCQRSRQEIMRLFELQFEQHPTEHLLEEP